MMISFAHPTYLFLLLVIPLLIIIYFVTLKQRKSYALQFANFNALARIKGVDILSKNIVLLILTIIISALLVFSLAGTTLYKQADASATSFVLAIDSSRSMEATDVQPSRFEAAKRAAISFIDLLPQGTRVGVISFSGNAFIEADLTEDLSLARQSISLIPLSSIGGTDLHEAVFTASNMLENEDAKAVILISDGRLNVGTVPEIIDYASKRKVIVHTIGFGSEEGGQTSYGISTIDEDALKSIAYNTGGRYFRATTEGELRNSYAQIITLKNRMVSMDLSPYLLLAAFILFIVEYILFNTRYRMIP